MAISISPQGIQFIAAHEGFVSKAYRCPAGVITIGYGFTNGSRVFSEFWRAKHGRALQMGDTITRADADVLLKKLIDHEYGAAVITRIGTSKQHEHDAASSVSFNCGTGSLGWKWAQALAMKRAAESARLLRTTAVTANGRRLAGLVRRRAQEADLIETGKYPHPASATSVSVGSDMRQIQQWLHTLGYDVGPIDGVNGPKTRNAVIDFQIDHDLLADGIVGPATRAALIRALDARNGQMAAGGSGAAGGATGVGVDQSANVADIATSALLWGLGAAVLVAAIFLFLKYRGALTGRRVPT